MNMASSFEDDFDAALRENFIIALLFTVSLGAGAWLVIRRQKSDHGDEPLLSLALSAVSFAFCFMCLMVIPCDQAIRSFTSAVNWLGINGTRFSRRLAAMAFLGSHLSLFLLNPFAYLFSEAPDGSWRSFWTTLLEVGLLLAMIFSIGMLFFTRATVHDVLYDPYFALGKLTSLLTHIPGCLILLYLSDDALLAPIQYSLNRFVPWRYRLGGHDVDQFKREIEVMMKGTHNRRGSGLAAVAALQDEIRRMELASSGHPLRLNLEAFFMALISFGSGFLIMFRAVLPSSVARRTIPTDSALFSLILPLYFTVVLVLAAARHRYAKHLFNLTGEGELERGSLVNLRTNSVSSLTGMNNSLSLFGLIALSLMISSSIVVVLTGVFELKVSFRVHSHPLLLSPMVSIPYCLILALRAARGFQVIFRGNSFRVAPAPHDIDDCDTSTDNVLDLDYMAFEKVQ